jgi:hypothetical protein
MVVHGPATRAGRFLLSFVELQVAITLGALVCLVLGRVVRAATFATAYQPGTVLYFVGDVFFLATPVVLWMVLRGRGWRHGLGLALAMLAPVAAIVAVGAVVRSDYLLWLVYGMYPALSLGMVAYVFRSRESFDTGRELVGRPAS